jgi:hypothetical protein
MLQNLSSWVLLKKMLKMKDVKSKFKCIPINRIQLLLCLFIATATHAQPTRIDYKNFDTKTASKMLFEKLNYFRDTITQTGYGKDLEVAWPSLVNNHPLMKLTWSQTLYDSVVLPNTLQNVNQRRLFHVDRRPWWANDTNQFMFLDEVYPTKKKGFRLTLTENGGYTTYKFETYEELADHMITCWESSFMHRCTQRSLLHNTFFLEKGYDSNTIAATCVIYDNGVCYFFVDFVY